MASQTWSGAFSMSATSAVHDRVQRALMIALNGCSASRGTGAQLPWNAHRAEWARVALTHCMLWSDTQGWHDTKPALKMAINTVSGDGGHVLIRVVNALLAVESQREGDARHLVNRPPHSRPQIAPRCSRAAAVATV